MTGKMDDLDNKSLRKFGITMGIVFLLISLLILIKSKHNLWQTGITSAVFFVLAFAMPGSLRLAYILWMRLAYLLSWINTRLILFILFYFIFTPMGLVMKLFKADLLDRKINKHNDSYWLKKEKKGFSPLDYERQF